MSVKDDQDRLQESLQACNPSGESGPGPDAGSLVVGWVVVTEWMGTDGQRWLSKLTHEDCTAWQQQGYLHNALNTDWSDDA